MGVIGQNIKRVRQSKGWATQVAFAERLGVTQARLSRWERENGSDPEIESLLKIAVAIPCSLDELVLGLNPAYDILRQSLDLPRQGGASSSFSPGRADAAAKKRKLTKTQMADLVSTIAAIIEDATDESRR